MTMWMVRAGPGGFLYNDFKEKKVVAIGWDIGDLTYKSFSEIKELCNKKNTETKNYNMPNSAPAEIYRFVNEIDEGDYVVSYNYVIRSYIVGKIISNYYRGTILSKTDESGDHYYDLLDVDWIGEISKEYLKESTKNDLNKRLTVYELDKESEKNLLNKVNYVEDNEELTPVTIKEPFDSILKRNIIYFGAPGTGKSYNLNNDMKELTNDYERVTFHPDYSYANFVGTYKPVPKGESISYEYVPGPFMRSLVKALKNPYKGFLLIIEEINRANVAAVFGDVFQLLDRNHTYSSRYSIETTEDMRNFLKRELNEDYDKIKIPSNLFIWATMNSADQGVFPMDTAFKRRWDFKYFGINHNEEIVSNIKVELNGQLILWNDLRKAINEELLSYKINEDKLLGPFFAFNEYLKTDIPVDEFKEIFKNKIIMYLFEDAARSKRNDLFSGVAKNTNLTYSEICEAFDEKGIEIFCDNIKEKFINEDE